MANNGSRFNGGIFDNWLHEVGFSLGATLSLGLAVPWLICWYIRWNLQQTQVDGRKLNFTGKGGGLFGRWLLWGLLCIVTLGIHTAFFLPVRIKQWVAENTHVM